jgi:tryptophan synthase alpha subunit
VVPNLKAPVVLFAYYNPILKRGPEAFMKAVKAAGASGVLLHHSSSFHDVQAPNARPYEASRIQMYMNTVG